MVPHPRRRRCILAFSIALFSLTAGTAPIFARELRISIVANHQPLRNVLLELGKRYRVDVVIVREDERSVDVALHDVTLAEALAAILGTRDIPYSRDGNVVIVGNRAAVSNLRAPVRSAPDALALLNISAKSALAVLHETLPNLQMTVGPTPNLLLIRGGAEDLVAAHRLVAAIDILDPTKPVSTAVVLQHADARALAAQLQHLFHDARFIAAGPRTLLAQGPAQVLDAAKAVIATLDVASSADVRTSRKVVTAVAIVSARPSDIARSVSEELPGVRTSVSRAGQVVIAGSSGDVARARSMIAQIDRPPSSERYVAIYRLRNVDARSVGDLITRTFRDVTVTPNVDLNSLAVTATASEHRRIADAIVELDGARSVASSASGGIAPVSQPGSDVSTSSAELITLKAAVPGLNGSAPTSATDIATAVGQALAQSAPDLHITVPANATQLILTGSPNSVRQAKDLIEKLDTLQKLVVLDTEIYEVDESTAKTLGLRFVNPIISTTYTETTPGAAAGGIAPPLLGLQQLSRTPLSLGAQIDFAVSTGKARIIADPRLTTISGRTASLRAGENLAIQTQVGGGQGTVATTQIQTFQTGVTLDITPVINQGDYISVTLHPTVNSNTGFVAGIPQISTRDTQTTVAMHEGQTLFIGGLIQDFTTRNESKVPFFGDIPVIGKIFRDTQLSYSRNELVITVTPHIIDPLDSKPLSPPPGIGNQRTPQVFPTIPPAMGFPKASQRVAPPPQSISTPSASPAPAPSGVPLGSASAPATIKSGSGGANVSLPSSAAPATAANPPANTFVFGQRPTAAVPSAPSDPPQILFATLTPTTFRPGASLHLDAITSTNVSRMTIGYNGFVAPINATTPGSWSSTFNFVASGLGALPQSINLVLTAYRQDGAQTTINVLVNLTQ